MARFRAPAHLAPSACGPHPRPALVRLALPAGAGAPDCSTGQVLPEMAARWEPPRGPGAPFRAGRRRAPPGAASAPRWGARSAECPHGAPRKASGNRWRLLPRWGAPGIVRRAGRAGGSRAEDAAPLGQTAHATTSDSASAPAPHPAPGNDRQRRAVGHAAALGTGAESSSARAGTCTDRPSKGGLLCRSGRLHRPPPYNRRYAQLLRNCPLSPHNSAVIRNRPHRTGPAQGNEIRRLRAGRSKPACGRACDAAGDSSSRRAELLAGHRLAALSLPGFPRCRSRRARPLRWPVSASLSGSRRCQRSIAPASSAPAILGPLVGRVGCGQWHLRPQAGHVAGPPPAYCNAGRPPRGPRPRPSRPASGRSGPRRLRRRGPDHPAHAGAGQSKTHRVTGPVGLRSTSTMGPKSKRGRIIPQWLHISGAAGNLRVIVGSVAAPVTIARHICVGQLSLDPAGKGLQRLKQARGELLRRVVALS